MSSNSDDSDYRSCNSDADDGQTSSDGMSVRGRTTRKVRTAAPATETPPTHQAVSPSAQAPTLRALDPQQEAMRQTARQMVVVWETLMPELDAMAKRVEEQAREAMRTSAMVNRLIGTHTGMIQQIALTLESSKHSHVSGEQRNA